MIIVSVMMRLVGIFITFLYVTTFVHLMCLISGPQQLQNNNKNVTLLLCDAEVTEVSEDSILKKTAGASYIGFLFYPVVYCLYYLITYGDKEESAGQHKNQCPPEKQQKRTLRRSLFGGHSSSGDKSGQESGQPPSKRGRKSSVPPGKKCGDCTVWLQLGQNSDEKVKHSMISNTGHPGVYASNFQEFLSVGRTKFKLNSDSCMCHACHEDCRKNYVYAGQKMPRWHNLRMQRTASKRERHCIVCHHLSAKDNKPTPCKEVKRWNCKEWHLGYPRSMWQDYLSADYGLNEKLKYDDELCHAHYMKLYHKIHSGYCKLCNTGPPQLDWRLVGSKVEKLKLYCIFKDIQHVKPESIKSTDWMCFSCKAKVTKFSPPPSGVTSKESKEDPIYSAIKQHIMWGFDSINEHGFIMRKTIVDTFRTFVSRNFPHLSPDELRTYMAKFNTALTNEITRMPVYGKYYVSEQSVGLIIYKTSIMSKKMLRVIVELMVENKSLKNEVKQQKESYSVEHIQNMVREQTKLFRAVDSDFDYRSLFDTKGIEDENQYFLHEYLYSPLVKFLEKVLNSGNTGQTQKENHKCSLKIQLIIALMSNVMNKNCILLQTLLGLVAYAGGLRDKMFNVFSKFGICCSLKHVRTLQEFWSKKRNVMDEISPTAFWRISFDNLNFLRKFANVCIYGAQAAAGRMLNLLTGQVTHRTDSDHIGEDDNGWQLPNVEDEDDLFPPDQEFIKYRNGLVEACSKRTDISEIKALLEDMQTKMPSYTPKKADTVAYARVANAQASSVEDVANYLIDLKAELHIGEPSYPQKVIICGDQQTYSIVRNLKTKDPELFEWAVVMPGDWHLLKLASETIRDLLWDGGFQDLARSCGHFKEVKQWRDIHKILCGIHEALLSELLQQYNSDNTEYSTVNEFRRFLCSDENTEQLSKFWASILDYLDAYTGLYFAIRSGNWFLRNSCIPKLAELFFAYSRDRYEELVCKNMLDVLCLDPSFSKHFERGEWTISISGTAYHNVALDEGHEQLINKRYISPVEEPLVSVIKEDNVYKFGAISEKAYIYLVTFVYMEKNFDLFSHFCTDVFDLQQKLLKCESSLTGELRNVLEWLGYDVDNTKVTTIDEWLALTQEVCLRQESRKTDCPKMAKLGKCKVSSLLDTKFCHWRAAELMELICPSIDPLKFHIERGNFVLSLALGSCSPYPSTNYGSGWHEKNGKLHITWDIDTSKTKRTILAPRKSYLKKCYCEPGRCTSCVNCFKACKPCTKKCKCKGVCENPHNSGGKCNNCKLPGDNISQATLTETTHEKDQTEAEKEYLESSCSSDSESDSDTESEVGYS